MTDILPLPPGSTVGIIGGGQLGRMLCQAAAQLGLNTLVLDPDETGPAAQICTRFIAGAYDDRQALQELADRSDVVTFEFENVPVEAIKDLQEKIPVRPNARALEISQDRLIEKTFLNEIGLSTAPFTNIESCGELEKAIAEIGTPSLLKTRRFGYDGKGQVRIDGIGAVHDAHNEIGHAPAILEAMIPFEREVSVIAVRGLYGEIVNYDVVENHHRNGILHTSTVPADISTETTEAAKMIARTLITALDYVGVLAVELFQTGSTLLVNEFAPRVHNSGHWTLDACAISQFENHIRAICGWPLGAADRHSDALMTNLIGREVDRWEALAQQPSTALHLYGKAEARPGRKMGHVTQIAPRTGSV